MTESFTLRPATEEDARAIHALVWSSGINPTGLKWPRFIVAVPNAVAAPNASGPSNGAIIGCGQIKPHADGSQELASIAVTPTWQGKGVARAIIEHLLAQHMGDLYLMCRSSVGPLYEKFGFRTLSDEELPPYFRRIKKLTKIAEFVMQDREFLLIMHRANK